MIVFYLSILFDKSRLKSNSNTKRRSKLIITRNFCGRLLSISDICRLISIDFIDYRNYRQVTSCFYSSDNDSWCNERFSISCCTSIVSKVFLCHFRYEVQMVHTLLQLNPIPFPGDNRLWISTDWATKCEFIPANSYIIWQVWARLLWYRHICRH